LPGSYPYGLRVICFPSIGKLSRGELKTASEAVRRRLREESGEAQDKSATAHPSSGRRTKKEISCAQIRRRQPGCFQPMYNKQGYEKPIYSNTYIFTTIKLNASEIFTSESSVSEELSDPDEIRPTSF